MTDDNDRRIIAIGDIHGMNESLTYALRKIHAILDVYVYLAVCLIEYPMTYRRIL
jgi:hypothetical protein